MGHTKITIKCTSDWAHFPIPLMYFDQTLKFYISVIKLTKLSTLWSKIKEDLIYMLANCYRFYFMTVPLQLLMAYIFFGKLAS